ncbi:MAG: iron-containing alcohol dehydrogenase, partial [Flavobacterium sp.]|nr:iron-containing alcohol dehydrogenase [Flavobacterium sp.]
MQTIPAGNYLIVFNENGVREINNLIERNRYSSIFLICDENSHEHCVPAFLSEIETEIKIEIIEIEAGEELKNITTCVDIWSTLAEMGADRKSLIINVGGGVISDIGGFIAATFKRGIDFINVPTTLLAMVDASVGGKNGVDLGHLKNQI